MTIARTGGGVLFESCILYLPCMSRGKARRKRRTSALDNGSTHTAFRQRSLPQAAAADLLCYAPHAEEDLCGGKGYFRVSETIPGLKCDDITLGALGVTIPGRSSDDLGYSISCGNMVDTTTAEGCSYSLDDCELTVPAGVSLSRTYDKAYNTLMATAMDIEFAKRRITQAVKGPGYFDGPRTPDAWAAGMVASASVLSLGAYPSCAAAGGH